MGRHHRADGVFVKTRGIHKGREELHGSSTPLHGDKSIIVEFWKIASGLKGGVIVERLTKTERAINVLSHSAKLRLTGFEQVDNISYGEILI